MIIMCNELLLLVRAVSECVNFEGQFISLKVKSHHVILFYQVAKKIKIVLTLVQVFCQRHGALIERVPQFHPDP